MNDAGELVSLRSNPRLKDRRAGAPIRHLIDIKTEGPGDPGRIVDIIERVEYVPIRPVSADDVSLLEPLYELGMRYHEARIAVENAVRAADIAVALLDEATDLAGWRDRAKQTLDAASLLCQAAALVSEMWALEAVGVALADAAAVVTYVVGAGAMPTRLVRRRPEMDWTRARQRIQWAIFDVLHQVVRRSALPWRQFAFVAWDSESRSWSDVWCAREIYFGLAVYPDATIGRAAKLTAAAARARRSRARSWRRPERLQR